MDKPKSMEKIIHNKLKSLERNSPAGKVIFYNLYTSKIVDKALKSEGYIHKSFALDEEKVLQVIHNSRLYNMAKRQAEQDPKCDLWYTFERGICLELAQAICSNPPIKQENK